MWTGAWDRAESGWNAGGQEEESERRQNETCITPVLMYGDRVLMAGRSSGGAGPVGGEAREAECLGRPADARMHDRFIGC